MESMLTREMISVVIDGRLYDDDYDLMTKVLKSKDELLCSFRGGSRDRLFFLRRRSLARATLTLNFGFAFMCIRRDDEVDYRKRTTFYVSSGKMSPLVDVVSAFNWFAVARR